MHQGQCSICTGARLSQRSKRRKRRHITWQRALAKKAVPLVSGTVQHMQGAEAVATQIASQPAVCQRELWCPGAPMAAQRLRPGGPVTLQNLGMFSLNWTHLELRPAHLLHTLPLWATGRKARTAVALPNDARCRTYIYLPFGTGTRILTQ